ncbi:hypothetical protein CPB86DRAFT_173873 [Serendipita vermifera]|nr:hypothetical protein CPB86DRAFT_173873 [Serendipita vermifera]
MPTFAELRAKAEAAANAAKENANSRIADYRGDKKPSNAPSSGPLSPNYKPPARRPSVKPPLPTGPKPNLTYHRKVGSADSTTSSNAGTASAAQVERPPPVRQVTPPPRPPAEPTSDEDEVEKKVEEEERQPERRNIYTKIVPPAVIRPGVRRNTMPIPAVVPVPAPAPVVGYKVEEKEEEKDRSEENGIQAILQNKALFFEFMDEFFARKGFNVHPREEAQPVEPETEAIDGPFEPVSSPPRKPEQVHSEPEEPAYMEEPEEVEEEEPEPQRVSTPPPIVPPAVIRPPPRRAPPAFTTPAEKHIDYPPMEESDQSTPVPSSPPPSVLSRSGTGKRSIPPVPTTARPTREITHEIPKVYHHEIEEQRASPPPPIPFASKPVINRSTRPSNASSTPIASPRPIPGVLQPSSVVQAIFSGLPSAPSRASQSSRRSSLSSNFPPPSVASLSMTAAHGPSASQSSWNTPSSSSVNPQLLKMFSAKVANVPTYAYNPPPPFFTSEIDESWLPTSPYGYMPCAGEGREPTAGQCSAAQLCSYFSSNVPWDQWYMSEDPSARPASIVDRVEARWKGSIMFSQETKKRLFGSEKVSTERTRVGVVTFQDLSIAWYRVTWKDEDPVKSLKREARYRAAPAAWDGPQLYAAHQTYGQAISDFCERAIRMKQFVGGGETFHLLEGRL